MATTSESSLPTPTALEPTAQGSNVQEKTACEPTAAPDAANAQSPKESEELKKEEEPLEAEFEQSSESDEEVAERIDESRPISEQLIYDKMWFFVPVLTFPHLLMFTYMMHYIFCIYYGNWLFLMKSLFFGFFIFYSLYRKSPKWYRICAVVCGGAFIAYMCMFIEMTLNDYNGVRVASRPAPTSNTAFFFSFTSLLAIWSFLVLGRCIRKTKRKYVL